MNRDYEHEYECEECEGTFTIKPDLDEKINCCPQCGNKTVFKHTHYIIESDIEDEYDFG